MTVKLRVFTKNRLRFFFYLEKTNSGVRGQSALKNQPFLSHGFVQYCLYIVCITSPHLKCQDELL